MSMRAVSLMEAALFSCYNILEIIKPNQFDAGELTMDAVWARAYKTGESDDSPGWRMAFSVRYGDIIVEVRTKGVDPEWVYMRLMEMLS